MIKENKTYFYSFLFLSIFGIIVNLLFIYNIILFKNIETFYRIILLIIITIITIFLSTFLYKTNNKKYFTSISIIFFLYLIILISINYNLNNIYNKINSIANNRTTYSTSIVTNKSNNNEDINKIKKIGIINNKDSIEGYIIPKEIISDNNLNIELIYYDDYITMINDLLNNNIEYIFLPSNYNITFNNIEFDSSIENTKIIYSQEKNIKLNNKSNKKLTEPFTILLMGVDSTENNISTSSFNGDALILITYNPKTYTSTILSIPRDSYINISCLDDKKNKITHAAWYNESCITDTLENTLDIDIDYYIKINFKGLVDLVDNLGGIEVNVPYSFCESNSSRLWGENTVYVEEGLQTINGEQALALTRNRHPWPDQCDSKWTNYYSSDIIRGENQQLVINALINKVKTIKSLNTIYTLLDTVKNNISTNLTTENILSFYNTSKDLDKISIQKLYLNGYDEYIYDYNYINQTGTKLTLYNYIPYQESLDIINKAMKDNLEGNLVSNNETIGKIEGNKTVNLMPNFIGKTYYDVVNFCNNHNIKLNINYVSGNNMGIVTYQSVEENTDIDYINSLDINVVNKINSNTNNNTSKNNKEDKNTDNTKKEDNNINTNNNNNNNNDDEKEKEDDQNSNELDPIIDEIFNN